MRTLAPMLLVVFMLLPLCWTAVETGFGHQGCGTGGGPGPGAGDDPCAEAAPALDAPGAAPDESPSQTTRGSRAMRGAGVSMECNDTHKVTDRSDQVTYDIVVSNTGDEEGLYYFSYKLIALVAPNGTEADVDKWEWWTDVDNATVAPGESFPLRFIVRAQCGCQIGVSAVFEVSARLSTDGTVTASVLTNTTKGDPDTSTSLNEFNIKTYLPLGYDRGIIARAFTCNLTIVGTWSTYDTLNLWIGSIPVDWQVTLGTSSIPLTPQSPKELPVVQLRIVVPEGEHWGNFPITVNAVLQNQSQTFDSDSVRIPVYPELAVLGLDADVDELEAGSPVTVRINVTNNGVGCVDAATVRLMASHGYKKGQTLKDERLIDEALTGMLCQGSEETVLIEWTPLEGEMVLRATIDSEGQDFDRDTDNNAKDRTCSYAGGEDGGEPSVSAGGMEPALMAAIVVLVIAAVTMAVVLFIRRERAKRAGPRKGRGIKGSVGKGRDKKESAKGEDRPDAPSDEGRPRKRPRKRGALSGRRKKGHRRG